MALKLEEIRRHPIATTTVVARPRRRLLAYNLAFLLTGAMLLALMGMSYLFLTRTGDTIPPSQAAARQASEDVMFGSALFFRPVPYKLALYRQRKPDVAIVGSSRAIEFVRRGFTTSMVNMGSMRDMAQIRSLLQSMFAAHRPKLVILTIDFWWFNSARTEEVVDLQPDTVGPLSLVQLTHRSSGSRKARSGSATSSRARCRRDTSRRASAWPRSTTTPATTATAPMTMAAFSAVASRISTAISPAR